MRRITAVSTLLALTSAFPSPQTSKLLPLVIWHGLGDNYDADGLKDVGKLAMEVNPGTIVYNIRLDDDADADRKASFFGNLTVQLEGVCDALATHPIISKAPAINALGFSQGGQFLRGYIQRCNNPPIRNLVTFGSQHNGIADFKGCSATDWLCKGAMGLLKANTWSHYIQSTLVPAQYYRTTDPATGEPTDEYLESSNWLADINNERKLKNTTYAKQLAKLSKFVMYMFEDDTTVIPKETGWFAEVNATDGSVTPLRNRTLYTEDWLGLKKLDEKDGLVLKTTKGDHMQLDDKVLRDVFKTYFAPAEAKDVTAQEQLENWEL